MSLSMPSVTRNTRLAQEHLEAGKPLAIPTETVYGLAALIDNENAVRQVFALKKRPLDHPLIVHVAKDADLSPYAHSIPEYAKILMKHFWPGPLTLVLPARMENLNPLITAGQSTVAIRSPRHPLTEKLLSSLKMPLVAPSANPFGKISPTTARHVEQAFDEASLMILDGGRCPVGIESTIVDATQPESYQILRQGIISETMIAECIPAAYLARENDIRVPGKLDSHYQPDKTLHYFEDFQDLENFCRKRSEKIYVLARQMPEHCDKDYYFSLPESPEAAAFELYYQLRLADLSAAVSIALLLPPAGEAWAGIRERIFKAGQPGK